MKLKQQSFPSVLQAVCAPQAFCRGDLLFTKAQGAKLYTHDGREFFDLMNGKGTNILGHNSPQLINALVQFLKEEQDQKTGFHPVFFEVTKRLEETNLNQEASAFFKTGTEAVKAAVYAAQQYTGKSYVLSAGYHGYDPFWYPNAALGAPNKYDVIDFYYDLSLLRDALGRHRSEVAAIIFSPDPHYLNQNWFQELNHIVQEEKLILIADEVRTGYRYCPGLLSHQYGLRPHISVVSKAIAQGFPLAVVQGQDVILSHISGFTFTAFFDPLTFVAASHVLHCITAPQFHQTLNQFSNAFLRKLQQRINDSNLLIRIVHYGSTFQFVLPTSELEELFYKHAQQAGLILYKKDLQSFSLAYVNDDIEKALLERFECLWGILRTSQLKTGQKPELTQQLRTAWNLIDGLAMTLGALTDQKRRHFIEQFKEEFE